MKPCVWSVPLLVAIGCSGNNHDEPATRLPPPPPLPALDPIKTPIRITPGDCASGKVTFEVGPRGVEPTPHDFGKGNPFAPLADELTRCLPGGAGTAVVELVLDANHRVNDATVFGIEGAAAGDCVERVAKTITFVGIDGPIVRCALAYGTADPKDIATADIGVDRVAYHDFRSTTAGLLTPTSPLFPAIDEHLAHLLKVTSTPELAMHGPFIIRPQDAAPMSSVNRVLEGARRTHVVPLLARATGKLVRGPDDETFPTPPVATGTGDGWVTLRARHLEEPRISVYVTPDAIWIGVSRVQEFERIAARDWPALENHLRAHKQDALFADYTDVEIAGDGGVTYADILAAIDRARTAGFPDWSLVTPDQLSARPAL